MSEKIKIEQHSFAGGIWIIGGLFTVGFLQLSFWPSVLALVIWPYNRGATLSIVAGLYVFTV